MTWKWFSTFFFLLSSPSDLNARFLYSVGIIIACCWPDQIWLGISITFNATQHNANRIVQRNNGGLRRLNCLNILICFLIEYVMHLYCLAMIFKTSLFLILIFPNGTFWKIHWIIVDVVVVVLSWFGYV